MLAAAARCWSLVAAAVLLERRTVVLHSEFRNPPQKRP
jgi:hypothetical protein